MERQWRCTVCGYIHTGNQPPDTCPVCGVDSSRFKLMVNEGETPAASSGVFGFALEMWQTFVLHAVAAHFPNGLLPASALFLALFLFKGVESFEATAFHLVTLCVLVTPLVLVSGLRDWQAKYGGMPGHIFYKKITLALILLILGIGAVTLRGVVGSWAGLGQEGQIVYLLLISGMLGCVTLLGHYGGQLVFMKNKI